MYAVTRLELLRYWRYIGLVATCVLKTMVLCMLALVLFDHISIEMSWLFLPMIAWGSLFCYERYLSKDAVMLIMDATPVYAGILRTGFGVLSLGLNLVLAIVVALMMQQGFWYVLMYWFVLDIVTFLLFCMDVIAKDSVGPIVGQLMLFPLTFPWLLMGVMSVSNMFWAAKLIIAAWFLMHGVGVYFYSFCIKSGE